VTSLQLEAGEDARPPAEGRAIELRVRVRPRGTVRSSRWVVAVCLCLTAGVEVVHSIWLSVSTSPFEDEGLYLYIGHRVLDHIATGSPITERPGSFFSGSPWLYPPLAALADDLGGLAAARALSLLFVIGAGLAVYGVASELFGRWSGLLANAVFLSNGSVMYQAHLATFDSMMMFLMATACYVGVKSARANHLTYGLVVSVLLTLACFTKYAGVAYVPVVALVCAAAGWSHWGWLVVRRALYVILATIGLIYFWIQLFAIDLIPGIELTTLDRTALSPASPSKLAALAVVYSGPWIVAALIAWLTGRRRDLFIGAALIVGTVVGPVSQIRMHESTSFAKHLAFGMVFAAPLVGHLLARLLKVTRFKALPTVAGFAVLLLVIGLTTSTQFLTAWVDDRPLVQPLLQALKASPGKVVLSEQGAAERYLLRNKIGPNQWADTYSFPYDHKSRMPAYLEAIQQSHFGVISLSLTTTYGKEIYKYLITNSTPYILGTKVPRYFRGALVGSWLVFVPRADG
jgi:4-amino-4-deoxy-L-arabinose transferase-like glycosyltransferase